MDVYLPEFMARGYSLVTLAKGNRAPSVTEACRTYGGFYLGTIGGAAPLIAQDHVVRDQVVDYADLGMEAVRLIEVRDLPAFVMVNGRGKGSQDKH
jgi:fumarate hydratase class I